MTTPNEIKNLKENQVFVFGSNLNGKHMGGSAKQAVDMFGAIDGQGEGLQGQSYAFPTLDKNMDKVSIESLKESRDKLYACAVENPSKQFLVTKVGCGIAGFTEDEMKEVFYDTNHPKNVVLPSGWGKVFGYKAFNTGLICRGFQYELEKDFFHKGKIELCEEGFHFCKSLGDVYNYYKFGTDIVIAEVYSNGDVIDEENGEKSVTNHLYIVRILNAEQASNNLGKLNSGHSNSGHRNSGHRNSGHWNSGHSNSGHRNSGHRNSGDWNSGDSNSGHWNSGHWNSGCFNMETPSEILVFGKKCSREKWDKADKPSCLYFDTIKYIYFSDMTDEEKTQNPSAKTTGGYIKKLDYKEAFSDSLSKASKEDIEKIKKLPNFNKKVFFEISGFMVV